MGNCLPQCKDLPTVSIKSRCKCPKVVINLGNVNESNVEQITTTLSEILKEYASTRSVRK